MKIYTKTGDKGTTALVGGKRVSKDALPIEVYGDLDELNSWIGLLVSQSLTKYQEALTIIQDDLFTIGAQIISIPNNKKIQLPEFKSSRVLFLENAIDTFQEQLEPLKHFILPSGTPTVASIHIARTVCRRVERRIVELAHTQEIQESIQQYINRLSDFLFVYARILAKEQGVKEQYWNAEESNKK